MVDYSLRCKTDIDDWSAPVAYLSSEAADVMTRRKRAARVTSIVHLVAAAGLGAFMVTTEGSSASANAGLAVTMAHVQEVLLAVAAVVQLALIAWWARLASAARRLRIRGVDTQDELSPRFRGNRAAIIGCMAVIVALAWFAEAGYLVQARYQVSSGGYSEMDNGFATVAMVLFALFAFAAGVTALTVKLTERAGRATAAVFAAANEAVASRPGDPTDPAVRRAALRRARRIAQRWAVTCGILMAAIVILAGWALATGTFTGRVAVMAPVLFLLNLTRFRQVMRTLRTIRHAEEALAA